jgi:hypothetical protein
MMRLLSKVPRPGWLLLALLSALALGCGQAPPRPADPDAARQALRAALDAWRQGEPPQELKARQPPIYVNDTDWQAGVRLTGYELKGDGAFYGVQYRCSVVLSVEPGKGRKSEKTVKYLIDTHPRLVIVRDDL